MWVSNNNLIPSLEHSLLPLGKLLAKAHKTVVISNINDASLLLYMVVTSNFFFFTSICLQTVYVSSLLCCCSDDLFELVWRGGGGGGTTLEIEEPAVSCLRLSPRLKQPLEARVPEMLSPPSEDDMAKWLSAIVKGEEHNHGGGRREWKDRQRAPSEKSSETSMATKKATSTCKNKKLRAAEDSATKVCEHTVCICIPANFSFF